MTDHPSLADLERAVEDAWDKWDGYGGGGLPILNAVRDYLSARRAARDAGYVSVQLRRTTLAMVQNAHDPCSAIAATELLWSELQRNIAAVLKPDGE